MIQDRLKHKDKEIKGMQRATAEMLDHCWIKGYQAGFDDGYRTGRSVETTVGEWKCVEDPDYSGDGYILCTACNYRFSFGAYRMLNHDGFCPHCGAVITNRKG